MKQISERQITYSDALKLIDSEECVEFDIKYRVLLDKKGNKENIYYSDELDENPELTVEQFIKDAKNYGSFWLDVSTVNFSKKYQIVDDNTLEPL